MDVNQYEIEIRTLYVRELITLVNKTEPFSLDKAMKHLNQDLVMVIFNEADRRLALLEIERMLERHADLYNIDYSELQRNRDFSFTLKAGLEAPREMVASLVENFKYTNLIRYGDEEIRKKIKKILQNQVMATKRSIDGVIDRLVDKRKAEQLLERQRSKDDKL